MPREEPGSAVAVGGRLVRGAAEGPRISAREVATAAAVANDERLRSLAESIAFVASQRADSLDRLKGAYDTLEHVVDEVLPTTALPEVFALGSPGPPFHPPLRHPALPV